MILSLFPFIQTLDTNTRIFLDNHIKPIKAPKGKLLFYQGDICKDILWLTKGEVRLYTQADSIEEITLYTLKEGEQCIVNTASLLSKTQAVASAIASTDIEGYLIDYQSIKELTHLSDAYQSYLFSLYHMRFEELTSLVNNIKFKRLDERIMSWLSKQDSTIIPITHEQLASELGTSRVVISRVLKELEQKEKIELHRGKITYLLT